MSPTAQPFRLVELVDDDCVWMLAGVPVVRNGLRQPPGGVDDVSTLGHVRTIAAGLRAHDCRAAWMMVNADEVVGLCGYRTIPSAQGEVEFGYGVAASRRRCGFATRAVRELCVFATRDPHVRVLRAETLLENHASARVLAANAFAAIGTRADPTDGVLTLWRREVPVPEQPTNGNSD